MHSRKKVCLHMGIMMGFYFDNRQIAQSGFVIYMCLVKNLITETHFISKRMKIMILLILKYSKYRKVLKIENLVYQLNLLTK